MKFSSLYNQEPEKSDKGTSHDYINHFYCPEFTPIRHDPLYIVEIGIHRGRSLRLLRKWFTAATIVGIDNFASPSSSKQHEIAAIKGVGLIFSDAYLSRTANIFPDNSIDYLIDDGPHTIESQIQCLELYWPKIKPGGKLIIEDIQDIDKDKGILADIAGTLRLHCTYQVIDLRINKGRYDDVLVVFKKPHAADECAKKDCDAV